MYSSRVVPIISVIFLGSSWAGEWSYSGDLGPSSWTKDCQKNAQSPIDIKTGDATVDTSLGSFDLTQYSKVNNENLVIKNNGHTVQLDIPSGVSISGGGLPRIYHAAQFHFHWGSSDSTGSEHQIDGSSYPLEMHIVHYSSEYGSISQAMTQPKGLAVIGVFFKVGSSEDSYLKKVIDKFVSATYKDDTATVTAIDLIHMIPDEADAYYRYQGSLTTPPCHESVIWTVMKDPIEMSSAQIGSFRNLKMNVNGDNDTAIGYNFRPIQSLNGRDVKASAAAGAATLKSLTPISALCAILFSFVSSKF